MALRKTTAIEVPGASNMQIENAYCKVEHLSGNKRGMSATIGIYKSKDALNPAARVIVEFTPDLSGPIYIALASAAAKELQ